VSWQALDSDGQMTLLFLLALASTGLLMKLVALLNPAASRETRWAFVFSPVVSPNSFKRSLPLSAAPQLALRTALFAAALLLHYWVYWKVVQAFHLRGILLSYLAVPAVLLIGELLVAVVTLLWLPTGRLLPPLHHSPLLARGVAEFWGRCWNLWFSDWFRSAIFVPLRRRPSLALLLVFVISGLMHEWVINVPLWFLTGKKLFGTMMLYFLLQAAGVLVERRFLKQSAPARMLWVWLVVFAPVPLLINEGLLRTLHLWPK
jgi:hypothetical protein